jgi:hypothetical protein
MADEISIHDNRVYAYNVDCDNRTLTLHTVYPHREPREWTDVIFQSVVAHHFDHVLQSNILYDITEMDVEALVKEQSNLFGDSWRFAWPFVEYKGDLGALAQTLKKNFVKAYSIDSSLGLSGWVLASGCTRRSRAEQAVLP